MKDLKSICMDMAEWREHSRASCMGCRTGNRHTLYLGDTSIDADRNTLVPNAVTVIPPCRSNSKRDEKADESKRPPIIHIIERLSIDDQPLIQIHTCKSYNQLGQESYAALPVP